MKGASLDKVFHFSTNLLLGRELIMTVIERCVFILFLCFPGSGSLAAMATFEDRFKPDMSVSRSVCVLHV